MFCTHQNILKYPTLLYKHRSDVEFEDASEETQKTAQVELEEISKKDVLKKSQVNPENSTVQPEVQLRQLGRLCKPVEWFSSSMYYLLLTDADEPECFDEAM